MAFWSSRFASAQKLNSRLLSNLSGVKRSKTFNISDEIAAVTQKMRQPDAELASQTLPSKARMKKLESSSKAAPINQRVHQITPGKLPCQHFTFLQIIQISC